MIKSIESLTFIFDDIKTKDKFRLFHHFMAEKIPIKIGTFKDIDLDHIVYYPVLVDQIDEDINYFSSVSQDAIDLARKHKLVIVFIYEAGAVGIMDLYTTFLTQLSRSGLEIDDVRFVTSDFTAYTTPPPFIFFPFTEFNVVDGYENIPLNLEPRSKRFTFSSVTDTEHSRLFGASLWYHSMQEYGYFNYPKRDFTVNDSETSIRNWHSLWSSTGTLMDMFGMHIPIINDTPPLNKNQYNDAYWNFTPEKQFSGVVTITERTYYPILHKQPFIIIGPAYSLESLRILGYKTFNSFIDEQYDDIENDEERMQAVFRLAYELANITNDRHDIMIHNAKSILDHNYQILTKSKKFRLLNLLKIIKDINCSLTQMIDK